MKINFIISLFSFAAVQGTSAVQHLRKLQEPDGCDDGCISFYCKRNGNKLVQQSCKNYTKDLGKNKVAQCDIACDVGSGGGGGGSSNGGGGGGSSNGGGNTSGSSTCINQPTVPLAGSICPESLSIGADTFDITCTGTDELTGLDYTGVYVCHEPNPGKNYPMLKCIPPGETGPTTATCGWCCLGAENDPGPPGINESCTLNPCMANTSDGGGVDGGGGDGGGEGVVTRQAVPGYFICTNNGGKPDDDGNKLKSKCVPETDALNALRKWGSSCGCCGGECPVPCSRVDSNKPCQDTDEETGLQFDGYEICHNVSNNPKATCVTDDNSLSHLLNHAGEYCITTSGAATDTCAAPAPAPGSGSCTDVEGWQAKGKACSFFNGRPKHCTKPNGSVVGTGGLTAKEACCVCGGGSTDGSVPTPTPPAPTPETPTPPAPTPETPTPPAPTPETPTPPAPTSETPTPPVSIPTGECSDVAGWQAKGKTCSFFNGRPKHCTKPNGSAVGTGGLTAKEACCVCKQ